MINTPILAMEVMEALGVLEVMAVLVTTVRTVSVEIPTIEMVKTAMARNGLRQRRRQ